MNATLYTSLLMIIVISTLWYVCVGTDTEGRLGSGPKVQIHFLRPLDAVDWMEFSRIPPYRLTASTQRNVRGALVSGNFLRGLLVF